MKFFKRKDKKKPANSSMWAGTLDLDFSDITQTTSTRPLPAPEALKAPGPTPEERQQTLTEYQKSVMMQRPLPVPTTPANSRSREEDGSPRDGEDRKKIATSHGPVDSGYKTPTSSATPPKKPARPPQAVTNRPTKPYLSPEARARLLQQGTKDQPQATATQTTPRLFKGKALQAEGIYMSLPLGYSATTADSVQTHVTVSPSLGMLKVK